MATFAELSALANRLTPELMKYPGVIGVGVGWREKKKQLALVVYIEQEDEALRKTLNHLLHHTPYKVEVIGTIEAAHV